jgi:hypothetical protein
VISVAILACADWPWYESLTDSRAEDFASTLVIRAFPVNLTAAANFLFARDPGSQPQLRFALLANPLTLHQVLV